jgi:hypothetical protein
MFKKERIAIDKQEAASLAASSVLLKLLGGRIIFLYRLV